MRKARYAVFVDGTLACICEKADEAIRIVSEYVVYLERPAYWVEWGR